MKLMLKGILKCQAEKVRSVTDGMIKSLNMPEDWGHQVHPKVNHPLWIVEHLGLADNFFLKVAVPNRTRQPKTGARSSGLGRRPSLIRLSTGRPTKSWPTFPSSRKHCSMFWIS